VYFVRICQGRNNLKKKIQAIKNKTPARLLLVTGRHTHLTKKLSKTHSLSLAHISPMWLRNLYRENGGKRRTWVQKRKKERGENYGKKERHTRRASMDVLP
jgi:hypothetical protein